MESVVETKVCGKCRKTKPLQEFGPRYGRPNGQRRSWCLDCYNRYQRVTYAKRKAERAKLVPVSSGTKVCCRCKVEKNVLEFVIARSERDGRRKQCRNCCAELTREENQKNPEKYAEIRRRANLKRCFGLTIEEYDRLMQRQGGVCAICGQRERNKAGRRMPVDHCHETGVVRGLLCSNCNGGIGKFHDDTEKMAKAIEYLKHHAKEKRIHEACP